MGTAGVEIDESPAIEKAELDVAKLAELRGEVPLLDDAATHAT